MFYKNCFITFKHSFCKLDSFKISFFLNPMLQNGVAYKERSELAHSDRLKINYWVC